MTLARCDNKNVVHLCDLSGAAFIFFSIKLECVFPKFEHFLLYLIVLRHRLVYD